MPANPIADLRELVLTSGVLTHPFFTEIKGPDRRAADAIRAFVSSDGAVAQQFSSVLSAIISRVSEPTIRMALVENLWDEHGKGDANLIHSVLFEEMAASIGVESYVHGGPAQAFIDLHFEVLEDSIPASIGMFCYVNEFLCLKEFPPIERRCRQLFPSFDDRYFVENTRVDGTHVRRLEQCLLPLLDSEAELKVTLDACAQALDLRSSLYDSVLRLAYA